MSHTTRPRSTQRYRWPLECTELSTVDWNLALLENDVQGRLEICDLKALLHLSEAHTCLSYTTTYLSHIYNLQFK